MAKRKSRTQPDPRPIDAKTTKSIVDGIFSDLFAEEHTLRCIWLAFESVPEINQNEDLGAAQMVLRRATERIHQIVTRLDELNVSLYDPKAVRQ